MFPGQISALLISPGRISNCKAISYYFISDVGLKAYELTFLGNGGWSLPGFSAILYHPCACSVAQSCLTLCNPLNCGLPGFSVHGISQSRILEWVAISLSKGSSQPRDQTQVCHIASDSKPTLLFFFNKERKIVANPKSIKSYMHINEIYNLSYRKK